MIILILEIAAGIAAYYFMKKKLTEKYSEDFVKSVKWMLIFDNEKCKLLNQ